MTNIQQLKINNPDGSEVHMFPTESDDGALVVLFAKTEADVRAMITRIVGIYDKVQFSSPRLTDGRWHTAGTVQ